MPNNSSDWREEDLLALIRDQVEESFELEYKASPSLDNTDDRKTEIGKDVSSFANSAGGTIIYGITETNGRPQSLDGQLVPSTTRKEWLEPVIHGRIGPRLDMPINPVSLATQYPGRVAYVVSVPQGKTAHQASDNKYYKRNNFQSVPMQDHEVRDVMNRSRHPLIEPVFNFKEITGARPSLLLRIALRNVGAMRARDIKLVISITDGLFSSSSPQFGVGTLRIDDQTYTTFSIQKTDLVIFPDEEFPLTDTYGPLTSTNKISNMEICLTPGYDLRWKVYADDMPPKEGRILLEDIPVR